MQAGTDVDGNILPKDDDELGDDEDNVAIDGPNILADVELAKTVGE